VLVDFTGNIHCRGPKLAGGALFTLLTIYAQAFPFGASLLYFYKGSNGEIDHLLHEGHLRAGLICLACFWCVVVVAFLAIINKEFLVTFYSKVTGWQFTINSFRDSSDPYVKMMTAFDNHLR